jgi:hypothetical protein
MALSFIETIRSSIDITFDASTWIATRAIAFGVDRQRSQLISDLCKALTFEIARDLNIM